MSDTNIVATATITTPAYIFFLGGADAEMFAIKAALEAAGVGFNDAGLGWGAKASAYGDAINAAAAAGMVPVLVELEADITVPEGTVVVDHHGPRAGEPASLLQVLALLDRAPSRWETLVAANDSGYIPAMLAIGATAEEVASVRLAERTAQGITPEQEAEAERAITAADAYALANAGELVVVTPTHSKCATVTDRLFSAWPGGKEKLLILSADGEVNFYGRGDICAALKEKFQGWNGGSGLGDPAGQGFWGGCPNHEEVLAFIRDAY